MTPDKIQHYGDELHAALLSRQPVEPLTSREPGITLDDAYQIQLRMIQRRLDAGETVVGKKIGVTSQVVMDMLGVNQPDFGHLLSGMVFNEGEPVDTGRLIAPRAEAEVAFILARDLTGPGVTAADVLRATDCVMPCFEIVDSRIRDWKIKIQDTVADNASCGVLTLGGTRRSPRDLDLALAGMVLEKNGEVVSTSCGASVQGSPVNAVAWLANTLGRLGITLKAGDVILSFDGQDVSDTRGLVRTVGNTEVGKTVRVVVYREGKTTTLKITLGRREEAEGAIPVAQPGEDATPGAPVEKTLLGLTLTPLSDELRAQLELDNSATGLVVVNIDELSEAYEKGLRAGDVITEAGQQKVSSIADLEDRIAEAKEAGRKSLLMLVRSGGDPRFVALSLEDNK